MSRLVVVACALLASGCSKWFDGISCNEATPCAPGLRCVEGVCTRCAAFEQVCGDGVDDDCDGLVDCADPDCLGRSCTQSACEDAVCRPDDVCERTPKPAGTICREATGPCDLEERCDGAGPACPPDLLAPEGMLCHASGGACDSDRQCNGIDLSCPGSSEFCVNPTSHWRWENPRPGGAHFYAVWGSSPRDVWIAGEGPSLFRWNGWEVESIPLPRTVAGTGLALRGLGGVPGKPRVWAVGDEGLILQCGPGPCTIENRSPGLRLNAVWALSDTERWAVGADASSRGVILRWNGTVWAPVTGVSANEILGIWGSGPDDIWAVGQCSGTSPVLHFASEAGRAPAWHEELGVLACASSLIGVSGSGPTEIWLVGSYTLLHRDAFGWTDVLSGGGFPAYHLAAVSSSGPNGAWVVNGDNAPTPALLHFEPGIENWTSAPGPMNAVWSGAPDDVWAVGNNGLVVHLADGRFETAPAVTHDLATVWSAGADFAVATWAPTPSSTTQPRDLVARWDGVRWAPDLGFTGTCADSTQETSCTATPRSIAGASATDVYLVGDANFGSEWNGSTWLAGSDGAWQKPVAAFACSGQDIWILDEGGGYGQSQLVHWNGTVLESPVPVGSTSSSFHALWVDCGAATVWVGGEEDSVVAGKRRAILVSASYSTGPGPTYSLTEVVPPTWGERVSGLWGTPAGQLWVVGSYEGHLLAANCSETACAPLTDGIPTEADASNLYAVWASPGTGVWAAGDMTLPSPTESSARRGLLLHWTPGASAIDAPTVVGNGSLFGITGTPDGEMWAVGERGAILRFR